MGVAIYGSHHDVGERITAYVESMSPGTDATMFGRGTASADGAALANASFGHAVDFDDTFESIVIHPTSPVFSAAFVTGEANNATGKDVLSAEDAATAYDAISTLAEEGSLEKLINAVSN